MMPSISSYSCIDCGSQVIKDQVTFVSHADHEGEPVETTRVGYFCTNKTCPGARGLDHDELICDDSDLVPSPV